MKCPRAIQPAEFILAIGVSVRQAITNVSYDAESASEAAGIRRSKYGGVGLGVFSSLGVILSVEAFAHVDTLNNLPARALSRLAVFNRAVAAWLFND